MIGGRKWVSSGRGGGVMEGEEFVLSHRRGRPVGG